MRTRYWAKSVAVAVGLVAGVFSSAVARGVSSDDFNYQRLQEGRMAFQQKRFGEAINEFRVAAFGSLDEPTVLTECLVRLALAEAAAGKPSDADDTLARFVDVEKRFGGFAKANLESEVRTEFQALLKTRVSPATLAGVPSLSGASQSAGRSSAPPKPSPPASASAPAPAPAPLRLRLPQGLRRRAPRRRRLRLRRRHPRRLLRPAMRRARRVRRSPSAAARRWRKAGA